MRKVVYFITEQLVYVVVKNIEYKDDLVYFTGNLWLNSIARTGKLVDNKSINLVAANVEVTLPRNTISITKLED